MNYLLRLSKRTGRVLVIISGVALLVMIAVTVVNVLGRTIFSRSLLGTVELDELCGAVFVSLALAITEAKRENVVMSMLIDIFRQRVRAIFDSFGFIVSIATTAVLIWAGAKIALEMAARAEVTPVLLAPVPPFRAVWVAGLIFLLVVLSAHLIEAARRAVKG